LTLHLVSKMDKAPELSANSSLLIVMPWLQMYVFMEIVY